VKNYFFNLLVMLDQCVNTILGGYPDETISLRTARERDINKKRGPAFSAGFWTCSRRITAQS